VAEWLERTYPAIERRAGRSIGGMRRGCVRRASIVAAMRVRARHRS
jgi:hypothetical protein